MQQEEEAAIRLRGRAAQAAKDTTRGTARSTARGTMVAAPADSWLLHMGQAVAGLVG